MHPIARRLVEHHGMSLLPVEATWFVSTYRSEAELADGAPAGTAMLGLYTAATEPGEVPSRSLFHRLTHDEVWHLYGGDPIRLVLLHPDGTDDEVVLGGDVASGARVQHVIPAGTWQAGELVDGGSWALFGCTMAPGFTGTCFEGGRRADLRRTHPSRAADIDRLGVPDEHATSMPDGFAT
ncbi:MAG: cupin domain-containing protein [Acidimicrobiales bacterium]